MRRLIFVPCQLLLAGLVAAQGQLPIPDYSSTYNYATHARGFYFTAPTNFTIIGLRVPDEQKHGLQNLAVYVLPSAPTGSVTPTYFRAGTPSSAILPVNIPVKTGEWVGILGTCGDAATSLNSYGSAPFSSNILGNPVTLTRLILQLNLVTSLGVGAITQSSGALGRVEVYIQGQAPWLKAKAEDYGLGTNNFSKTGYLPLPPFKNTYTSNYSRGYYFQAPMDFVVTGLQAFNEANQSTQAVAFYQWTTPPTAWPTTFNGTPAFYDDTTPATSIVTPTTPLRVKTGEWVGVVGGCHTPTSTTMSNSYGSVGPFGSNVLGQPIQIARLVFQADFRATKGVGTMATEDPYEPCRVKLFVAGQPGVSPAMTTTALPVLGTTAALGLAGNDPSATAGLVLLGLGRAKIPTVFGDLLVMPPLFPGWVVTGGSGDVKIPIPMGSALAGAMVNFQGFVILPAGVATSNGTEWTLGV